ncbi:MAG: UDP-N-acetylglucosamine 1-carboxyvinyltransferase [Candidatus Hydrogenedentota bacterium]|nr:MAG: UDP-N-acetylglucosamine 1-carboxyvinyltransferase [Candidatus Hydrogenedentota bacterium]
MSDTFFIEGGKPLSGILTPQGNKNEALPLLCCALLNTQEVLLRNVPRIEDIERMLTLIRGLGAHIEEISPHDLKITVPEIQTTDLDPELTSAIRGSVTLLAPLLARKGEVFLPRPGGDKIGRRRIDTHLDALAALGAKVEVFHHGYRLTTSGFKGTNILLDEASVTGTENAIMAAAIAEGITVLENAASEPHVQGLCNFLQKQGVKIEGVGSNVLTIHGLGSVEKLTSVDHTIQPDYLEIISFVSAAVVTGGELTVQGVIPNHLRMIRHVFSRLGIEWNYTNENNEYANLIVPADQSMQVKTDVHGEIIKIDDAPWPAFPADLISIALVTATQCKGTVLMHEKLFESRLFFTDKLIGMGARLVLCDPHRVVVIGPSKLFGARMSSPDIRAGMALVIAALCAEGQSEIQNVIQIDRGYEKIDERLRSLGAKIERK